MIIITIRMRGKAQLDGRPLLPPSECYWVVNASPLNYGRWVGQNSGPIFSLLWTKLHQIVCLCGTVRSLQRRFPIDDVRESRSIATLSEIAQKNHFLCCQVSDGRGPRISDRIS